CWVGSSAHISLGGSTFLKEMNETASIINNFSDRSFFFLVEIGRGASNDDGISLAWSIIEFFFYNILLPPTFFASPYPAL
ncbi:DNA mismatch repair protein mutS, partial [Candidatus Sulcia muelleri str. Hc (Homalodisca coagulata)]